MTTVVIFVGPAGSGKSTLTGAYARWLRRTLFLKVGVVNLDPGAEELPYKSTLDVRSRFTLRDVMKRWGLGPNGAFLKFVELLEKEFESLAKEPPLSEPNKWDFIIVDTPGQLEAVLFRPEGGEILRKISRLGNSAVVYVIDPTSARSPRDALFLWLMAALIQLKIGTYVVPAINKADVADPRALEIVERTIERPESLLEGPEEGVGDDYLAHELVELAIKTKGAFRAVKVSALTGEGLDALHALIHEAFCACGDLT
ncbi:MAG: ATP/GTP-binding protein [Desulfurococcaceae archaeon]